MHISSVLVRSLLLGLRAFQWISALIVMGISSYFIAQYDSEGLVIYEEVIAVLSVVFLLPGLTSPFMARLGWIAFPVDLVFSYLWLVSFVFMARDYSGDRCRFGPPPGANCSTKHADMAFAFFAFLCTLCGAVLEVRNLWIYRKDHPDEYRRGSHSKETRPSGDTNVTGTTAGEPSAPVGEQHV